MYRYISSRLLLLYATRSVLPEVFDHIRFAPVGKRKIDGKTYSAFIAK